MLRAGAVVCATCNAPIVEELATLSRGPREFSQLEGQRPIGVKSTRYLRAWRRVRDAGDAECRADGRARLMTVGAWERWGASAPARVTRYRGVTGNAPALPAVTDDVLAELGLGQERRTA